MAAVNLGRVGLNPMGEYDENTAYERLDVVSYMGSAYCAVRAVKGVPPGDGGAWRVMARLDAAAIASALGYIPADSADTSRLPRLMRAVSVLYDINRGITYRTEEDSLPENRKTVPSGAKAAVSNVPCTARGRNMADPRLFEQGDVISSLEWGTNTNRVVYRRDIDVSGLDWVTLSCRGRGFIYARYRNGVCTGRNLVSGSTAVIDVNTSDMLRFCLMNTDGTPLSVEDAVNSSVMLEAGRKAGTYRPYTLTTAEADEPFIVEPGGEITFDGNGGIKWLIALNEVEL